VSPPPPVGKRHKKNGSSLSLADEVLSTFALRPRRLHGYPGSGLRSLWQYAPPFWADARTVIRSTNETRFSRVYFLYTLSTNQGPFRSRQRLFFFPLFFRLRMVRSRVEGRVHAFFLQIFPPPFLCHRRFMLFFPLSRGRLKNPSPFPPLETPLLSIWYYEIPPLRLLDFSSSLRVHNCRSRFSPARSPMLRGSFPLFGRQFTA